MKTEMGIRVMMPRKYRLNLKLLLKLTQPLPVPLEPATCSASSTSTKTACLTSDTKIRSLFDIIRSHDEKERVLIFCNMKKSCDWLKLQLTDDGEFSSTSRERNFHARIVEGDTTSKRKKEATQELEPSWCYKNGVEALEKHSVRVIHSDVGQQ